MRDTEREGEREREGHRERKSESQISQFKMGTVIQMTTKTEKMGQPINTF